RRLTRRECRTVSNGRRSAPPAVKSGDREARVAASRSFHPALVDGARERRAVDVEVELPLGHRHGEGVATLDELRNLWNEIDVERAQHNVGGTVDRLARPGREELLGIAVRVDGGAVR